MYKINDMLINMALSELYIEMKNFFSVDSFAILSLCSTIGLIVSIILCVHYKKKYKSTNYYLDIVRTVSLAIAKNNTVIAFNEDDEIVYSTHPMIYKSQDDFINKLHSELAVNLELKALLKAIDTNSNCNVLLTGRGKEPKSVMASAYALSRSHLLSRGYSFVNTSVTVVVLTEITRYYSQTEELLRSYRKLENFIDNLPIGIFYIDKQGKILGCNITFSSYLHLSKDKVIGSQVTEYIDNFEMSKIYSEPLRVTLKSKALPSLSVFLIKPPLVSFSSIQPLLVLKTSEISNDITSKPNTTVDTFAVSTIPSVIISNDGTIKSKNPAFIRFVNNNRSLELRKKITEYFVAYDRSKSLTQFLLPQNPLVDVVFNCSTNLDKRVQVYHTNLNSTQQILLQFIELPSQNFVEQQFIQSQKTQAIGQLASGIAHDFNNLLTAMIGFCDLLLHRYTPDDPSYNDVVQIKQNAGRAANLVKQLLAFSRQQTLKPQVVSITDTLMDISPLIKRLLGSNVDFRLNHGVDIWSVKIDNSQFEQVVMNLSTNARDAMKGHGTLTIQTRNYYTDRDFRCFDDIATAGDYVLLEVIDTGCGMDQETIRHIFEPFFTRKISDVKNGTGSGTGLGLATVYGIVKQTGGHIIVESVVGKGTKFQIFIPRYKGDTTVTSTESTAKFKDLSGTETILLVEDEEAVRRFVGRALRDKGYNVIETSTGEEALKIATDTDFALLITDVIMPKIDGPTLNKKLREVKGNFKTIFISGYTEDTFRQDLDKDLGIHFMQKPFTLRDLANKVKKVLNA